MTTSQKSSLLFLSMLLVIFSCKKDDNTNDNNTSGGVSYASIDHFLTTIALPGQTFGFLAQSGTTFTGAKGSVVTVPANAFQHDDGSLVTGFVEMELKEVFSYRDMIKAQKFPVSWSDPLNSGGEFFLEARQNGVALALAEEVFVQLEIPAQAEDDQMLLFFDAPEEILDSADAGWQVAGAWGQTNSSFSFNSVDGSYEINLDSCQWGNIDAFMWGVTYFDTNFDLIGVDGLDNANTTAYALFVDENSVWPLGESSWGNISANLIHETHLADVAMNIVVISVVDGQLYSGHLEVTPEQDVDYEIQMSGTTSGELDELLENMP